MPVGSEIGPEAQLGRKRRDRLPIYEEAAYQGGCKLKSQVYIVWIYIPVYSLTNCSPWTTYFTSVSFVQSLKWE